MSQKFDNIRSNFIRIIRMFTPSSFRFVKHLPCRFQNICCVSETEQWKQPNSIITEYHYCELSLVSSILDENNSWREISWYRLPHLPRILVAMFFHTIKDLHRDLRHRFWNIRQFHLNLRIQPGSLFLPLDLELITSIIHRKT